VRVVSVLEGKLKSDNQWRAGIVFEDPETKQLTLVDSVEEANEKLKRCGLTIDKVEHRLCKFNWNHGQSIVEFENEQWILVDLEK